MNLKRLLFSTVPVLFACVLFIPTTTHAATPTLTADEVVANVTAGTDDQTDTTSPTQANAVQVKATRTLTVANALPAGSVLASSVSFTIGTCVVTLGTVAQDTDCSNNTAAIATTTDATAAAIATRLISVTGLSDTGHGAIAITASTTSSTNVVFTTSGSETAAGNITYTANTATNISSPSYATVAGVVAAVQINTITIAGTPDEDDVFTATLPTVGAVTYTVLDTDTTNTLIAAGLGKAIVDSASYSDQAFTAATSTNTIVLTAKVAGTGFVQTSGAANRAAVAQEVTFTPSVSTGNTRFDITINGTQYRGVGGTVKHAVESLQPLVDANAAVTCTEDDTLVDCTADSAGTVFTYNTNVTQLSGGGGGGGGGSSSSHTSSNDSNASVQAQINTLLATIASLNAQLGHGSTGIGATVSAFARDLTIGASGDDVKMLQVWLNSHGFPLAASGVGSAGNETTLFGGLTQAALAKWQASVGISPAAGYFGPKTRAYLAAHQ